MTTKTKRSRARRRLFRSARRNRVSVASATGVGSFVKLVQLIVSAAKAANWPAARVAKFRERLMHTGDRAGAVKLGRRYFEIIE